MLKRHYWQNNIRSLKIFKVTTNYTYLNTELISILVLIFVIHELIEYKSLITIHKVRNQFQKKTGKLKKIIKDYIGKFSSYPSHK
jgi:hypothetical protein